MAKQPSKGRKAASETGETPDSGTRSPESVETTGPLIDVIPPEIHAQAMAETAPTVEEQAQPEPETIVEAAPKSETPARPQPATQQSSGGGFLPLALGGLLAGVIGFAVATFTAPAADDGLSVQVARQSTAIAALEDQLAALPGDGSAEVAETLGAQIAELSDALADISGRLDALEARPEVIVSGDSDAGAAVAADVDALRAQLAEMAAAAQTELEEARAAAAQIEENAAAAARNAAARAALARVQTALESGSPIGAALGDLEDATGESAPAELIAVADGVPTLPALQDSFPDAARAALATARREGVAGEETSGIGAFLRNQFDVRSTAPREGSDVDAILSRAEAALRGGRLSDALAELGALPEVARAEMSEWLSLAEARASAVAAADILSTSLSDN